MIVDGNSISNALTTGLKCNELLTKYIKECEAEIQKKEKATEDDKLKKLKLDEEIESLKKMQAGVLFNV